MSHLLNGLAPIRSHAVSTAAQFIDMSYDLFDLPNATRIVLDKIQDKRWHLNKNGQNTPIVLLMGEDHDLPLTQIFQLCVLRMCHEQGLKCAFGYEARYDFINDPNVLNLLHAKIPQSHLPQTPQDHRDTLDPQLILNCTSDEPILHSLISYCLSKNISFMFNDAARHISNNGRHILINSDPINQRVAKKLHYRLQKNMIAPKKQYMRNYIMTEHIRDQITRTAPDILIQMLGDNHVLGCDDLEFPYSQSMAKLCRDAGLEAIPVITSMEEEELPDDADLSNALIFEGWTEQHAYRDRSAPAYKRFIRKSFTKAGLAMPPKPPSAYETQKYLLEFAQKQQHLHF